MKKILTTLALVGVITTGAQAQSILISEINSNGTGGDFFEIYNYGATAVELGGWKWVDNASALNGGPSFNGARAFAFNAFTLNPGAIALVVTDASGNAAGNTAFANSWGLSGVNLLTFTVPSGLTGNGLGQNDLVALFNSAGVFQTGLNYGTTAATITQGDSTTVSLVPFNRVNPPGGTSAGGHAGAAGGGAATQSLIWDPASPGNNSLYTAASSVGLYGSFENPNSSTTIGSPGVVPAPSTYAVLALAGAGLAAYRLRRRARR